MLGARFKRTYLIDIVRKNAFKIFAIRSVTDVNSYAKGYDRSTVPVFANMLKSPKNPDETYAMYLSILFKNYEVNNTGLFVSRTRKLLTQISNICQEIHDMQIYSSIKKSHSLLSTGHKNKGPPQDKCGKGGRGCTRLTDNKKHARCEDLHNSPDT